MLNEKDIYSHLANGGAVKDLYVALENEIHAAQDRIIKEKDAELKQKELAKRINEARKFAVATLKDYFALVNPKVDDKMIDIALDALKDINIEIKVVDGNDGLAESAKAKGTIDGPILFDKEWADIWNTVFPFHFKSK